MAKLTLSVRDDLVTDAKHLALEQGTTVSGLVEEGIETAKPDYLHTLAALSLRAWHHFPDATPFIFPAILAFRSQGFAIRPFKTSLRLIKGDRRYVLDHRREAGRQVILIHLWGADEEIARVDVTELQKAVRSARGDSDYGVAIRPIWRAAKLVRQHADGRPGGQAA